MRSFDFRLLFFGHCFGGVGWEGIGCQGPTNFQLHTLSSWDPGKGSYLQFKYEKIGEIFLFANYFL